MTSFIENPIVDLFFYRFTFFVKSIGGGLRGNGMGQGMVGKSISSVVKNTYFDLKLEWAF